MRGWPLCGIAAAIGGALACSVPTGGTCAPGCDAAGAGAGGERSAGAATAGGAEPGCGRCMDSALDSKATGLCAQNGPPSSSALKAALVACACGGPCASACADSYCASGDLPGAGCLHCIEEIDTGAGCLEELLACVQDSASVTGGSVSTGTGGSSATSGMAATAGSAASTGGGGGAGGGGGGPDCVDCSGALNGASGELCPGTMDLVDALFGCACEGACMSSCGDNVCQGEDTTPECDECVTVGGCAGPFSACVND